MGGFIKAIGSLFGGGDAAAEQQAQQQQQLGAIAQTREAEATQAAGDTSNTALAALSAQPRGQRLLLSSTKDGGLASTLGDSA